MGKGYGSILANKFNTFISAAIGGTSTEAAMAIAAFSGAGKWGTRGRGLAAAGKEFAGAGIRAGALSEAKLAYKGAESGFMKRSMAALDTIGPDTFRKGYGARIGIGAGIGAAAGGAKSYYDGDGVGGYASNMLGGATLGAAGGHSVFAGRTPGTVIGNLGQAFKAGWKA